jgi:hypothetical protein
VKILKIIIYFFLCIILFSLIALVLQFVINKKYTFPEPHAFQGEYLYNPYKGMDSTKWKMANFHAHTRVHLGMTSGASDSNEFLDSFYKYFGYDIIGISDYQSINTFEGKNKWFIPVYEHGYQYYKNHHLVLNAKKVSWLDYCFRQTLSNKQFIIDRLKKDTTVVLVIPHPALRQANSFNDFRYLSNYDCLEIANNERLFTSYYDTILSAGHPVFLMADDDSHDLRNINEACQSFNLINSDLFRDSILHAIKTGLSVGVDFNIKSYKTNEEKKAALQKLPEITCVALKNDTLFVGLNKSVKTIKFIGQQGTERKIITNCVAGNYFFSKVDTYIRTEIECNDGTVYYLNPVFRYDGIRLTDYAPSYNYMKTWFLRSISIVVFLLILFIWKKKKEKRKK